jgi:hypothetical protein
MSKDDIRLVEKFDPETGEFRFACLALIPRGISLSLQVEEYLESQSAAHGSDGISTRLEQGLVEIADVVRGAA